VLSAPPTGTPPASGCIGPHLQAGRGHSTPRTKRQHAPPVRCQLWTCQSCTKAAGTQSTSRHTVETVAGAYATTSSAVPGGPGRLAAPSRLPLASISRSTSPLTQAPRARAPNVTSQRQWGGSTPNHPAALCSGMKMGFETPEQHHIIYTPPTRRERTHVLYYTHKLALIPCDIKAGIGRQGYVESCHKIKSLNLLVRH
jgi:hypothetical protein